MIDHNVMKKLLFIPIPIKHARHISKSTWDRCIQADLILCAHVLKDAFAEDLPKFKEKYFFVNQDELYAILSTSTITGPLIALLYPIEVMFDQEVAIFKNTLAFLCKDYALEILPSASPLMLSSYQVLGLIEQRFNLFFKQDFQKEKKLPDLEMTCVDSEMALIQLIESSNQCAILSGMLSDHTLLIESQEFEAYKAMINYPCYFLKGAIAELKSTLNLESYYPLLHQEIILTRADGQMSALSEPLQSLGARTIACPSIAIHPMDSQEALIEIDQEIHQLLSYDWVIFTSVNGVRYFLERLYALGLDMRAFKNAKIACIGSATAKALKQWGLNTDLVPKAYVAESLIEAFESMDSESLGKRVLIPRALEAREILPAYLRSKGLFVKVLTVYQTKSAIMSDQVRREILSLKSMGDLGDLGDLALKQGKNKSGYQRIVCFTANSTVEHFCALWTESELRQIQANTVAIAIGPISGQKAQKVGFELVAQAEVFHIEGLVEAVVRYVQSRRSDLLLERDWTEKIKK
jgi:uroporphyrinogen-III synthase